jgi:transaldolase
MVDSYQDMDKGIAFCFQAQRYFETKGSKTKVLAASLTSIDEVMQLAGVHHITISPPLLAELAATPAEGWKDQNFTGRELNFASQAVPLDESAWRMAFTRSKAGKNEGKIVQAINIFADMQDRLENMVRTFQARA